MKIMEFAIIELVAFFSAGYRIDEQYRLPYKKNWYMIKLNKNMKKIFIFKSKENRREFVLAGVIGQCLAYIMFWVNMVFSFILKDEGEIANWISFNYCVIGIMLIMVFLDYLFYKYYRRKY